METVLIVYNIGHYNSAINLMEDLVYLDVACNKEQLIYKRRGSNPEMMTKNTRYITISATCEQKRGLRAHYIYYDDTLPEEIINHLRYIACLGSKKLIKINLK